IDPNGVYQISGYRGTSRFVEITQQAVKLLQPAMMDGGYRLDVTNDLDELSLGEGGYFSVVLSAERPAGALGNWWRVDAKARSVLGRRCSCDWNREVAARAATNRLDEGGGDMAPPEIARRFSEMATWVQGMIEFDMRLVRYYREHHGI